MRVEITGQPLQKPSYAERAPLGRYLNSLVYSVRGLTGARTEDPKLAILAAGINADSDKWTLIAQAVAAGPVQIHSDRFALLTTALTRRANRNGNALVLTEKRDPVQVEKEVQLIPRGAFMGGPSYETRLGQGLLGGLLVFNGNLDRVQGLRGGTVHVNGDVKRVSGTGAGVIYVNGDIDEIGEAEGTIIVAAGKVHRYTGSGRHNGSSNTGSPFVFASEVNNIQPDLDTGLISDLSRQRDHSHMTVKPETVTNWQPGQSRRNAMQMAKGLLIVRAMQMLDESEALKTPQELANYVAFQLSSFARGHAAGYDQHGFDNPNYSAD